MPKSMTVRELISELNRLISEGLDPDEHEVITEGCDCYGECVRLSIHKGGENEKPFVLLERTPPNG